jgi:hypothetical protein
MLSPSYILHALSCLFVCRFVLFILFIYGLCRTILADVAMLRSEFFQRWIRTGKMICFLCWALGGASDLRSFVRAPASDYDEVNVLLGPDPHYTSV